MVTLHSQTTFIALFQNWFDDCKRISSIFGGTNTHFSFNMVLKMVFFINYVTIKNLLEIVWANLFYKKDILVL